jgi:hypothetical protein
MPNLAKSLIFSESKQTIAVKHDDDLNHDYAVANFDLEIGTVISRSSNEIYDKPDMHTICVDENTHVTPDGNGKYLSHACSEGINCSVLVNIITKSYMVVTTKKVSAGDTLAFNYNTTEWDMSSPFQCACVTCKKDKSRLISGFKHLSEHEKQSLLEMASPFIKAKIMSDTPILKPKL